jgi:hypothetical protein
MMCVKILKTYGYPEKITTKRKRAEKLEAFSANLLLKLLLHDLSMVLLFLVTQHFCRY